MSAIRNAAEATSLSGRTKHRRRLATREGSLVGMGFSLKATFFFVRVGRVVVRECASENSDTPPPGVLLVVVG